jgi:hypothetical protein
MLSEQWEKAAVDAAAFLVVPCFQFSNLRGNFRQGGLAARGGGCERGFGAGDFVVPS